MALRVIHLFKKHAQVPKQEYTPEFRKAFFEWEDRLVSQLGFVENKRLVLPAGCKERINLSRTGTLVIQDILGYSEIGGEKLVKREMGIPDWFLQNQLNHYPEWIAFNKENHVCSFELFSLQMQHSGELELFLKYDEFLAGGPKREAHKLCALKTGEAVEIRINGKSDATMSRGKQRTYSEFDYIIQSLGDVEMIDFEAESKVQIMREIPWRKAKMIDLRKMFY